MIPWLIGGFVLLKVLETIVEEHTAKQDRADSTRVKTAMEHQRRLFEERADARYSLAQHELQRVQRVSEDPRWQAEIEAARQRLQAIRRGRR